MAIKLIKRKSCSVNKCFADREDGDSLFCNTCRLKWRDYYNNYFGDSQAEEEVIAQLLKEFQNRL